MILSILAAIVVAQASPAPAAIPKPAPVSTSTAAYVPQKCGDLIKKAGLEGKPVTNESIGELLIEANKEHGAVNDQTHVLNAVGVGRALLDYYSCFTSPVAPKAAATAKPAVKK